MEILKKQILELASEMKNHPKRTDSKLLSVGKACLSHFQDANFGPLIPHYERMMQDLYLETIFDLAHGAPLLNHHTLGIAFFQGKLVRFTLPYSETNSIGTVVCSINRKSRKAFENHLLEDVRLLTQDQINASIYLLTFHLSKF